jgi:hypothetical protein
MISRPASKRRTAHSSPAQESLLRCVMTLDKFRQFSLRTQLLIVLSEGVFLAQRMGLDGGANLYHLSNGGRGFFVVVGINDGRGRAVVLGSFSDSEALADYAYRLRYEKAPTDQGFFYNLTA